MMANPSLRVPIVVELTAPVYALLDAEAQQTFAARLAGDVRAFLRQLGLAGEPVVEVQVAADSHHIMQIQVHGAPLSYDATLPKRLWLAVAPVSLHGLIGVMDPDLAHVGRSGEGKDQEVVRDYLAALAREMIRDRASCLVGPAQAAAYLDDGFGQQPGTEAPASVATLLPLLTSLLDLRVSVADKAQVLQAVAAGNELGRPIEDTMEITFAQLRSNRIAVLIHPTYLAALASGQPIHEPASVYAKQLDARLREPFRTFGDEVFLALGIHLPDVIWTPSPQIDEGYVAFKINDWLGFPMPSLLTTDLLVNDSADALESEHVPARSTWHPALGPCAIVSDAYQAELAQGGYVTWTAVEFVALTLASEIRRVADCLLSVEDVEYQLAQLESTMPRLAQTAAALVSIGDLTRLLRALLREDLPIRDLRAILERLVVYDTIPIDPHNYVVFDDRLAVGEGAASEVVPRWLHYLDFVRSDAHAGAMP